MNEASQQSAAVQTERRPEPVARSNTRSENRIQSPSIQSFEDVVRLAATKRDAKLRTELEGFVHLVNFAPGKIELRLSETAPQDLAGRLTQRLKEWTGRQWVVSVNASAEGAQTMRAVRHEEVMAHPLVKKALELFPGAEVTAIKEADIALAPVVEHDGDDHPVDPDGDIDELFQHRSQTRKP